MKHNHQASARRISIADLLIFVTVAAIIICVGIPITKIAVAPQRFAASLSHQTAGILMLVCSIGLLGFPITLGTLAVVIARKTTSPLRNVYATIIAILAICSVPIAYRVASACVGQVAG